MQWTVSLGAKEELFYLWRYCIVIVLLCKCLGRLGFLNQGGRRSLTDAFPCLSQISTQTWKRISLRSAPCVIVNQKGGRADMDIYRRHQFGVPTDWEALRICLLLVKIWRRRQSDLALTWTRERWLKSCDQTSSERVISRKIQSSKWRLHDSLFVRHLCSTLVLFRLISFFSAPKFRLHRILSLTTWLDKYLHDPSQQRMKI